MKPLKVAVDIVQSELPMDTHGMQNRLQRALNDILLQQGVKYQLTKIDDMTYTCLRYTTSIFEDNSTTYTLVKTVKGNWACNCIDYEKAPFNLCKHRLAVMVNEEVLT